MADVINGLSADDQSASERSVSFRGGAELLATGVHDWIDSTGPVLKSCDGAGWQGQGLL